MSKCWAKYQVGVNTFEVLPRIAYWKYKGSEYTAKHILIGWLMLHFDICVETFKKRKNK